MPIESTIGLMTAIGALLAFLIAIITAATTVRTSSHNNLKDFVNQLSADLKESKTEVKQLAKDLKRSDKLNRQYEDYIRALIRQLEDARIVPNKISDYVNANDKDDVE